MPPANCSASTRNRLLDSIPAKDRARFMAGCERVDLAVGEQLAEVGFEMRSVYFPTGCFISLLLPMGAESRLEVARVGNEGIQGVGVALGVPVSSVIARVQVAGSAWRMGAAAFRRELELVPALRSCVDRYVFLMLTQIMQSSACNRFHVVEQRVSRWLLVTGDRARSPTFPITHDSLATMLGVRRVGITEAASALQSRKLITYTRGVMTILDRAGLIRASCSCYRKDLAAFALVFG